MLVEKGCNISLLDVNALQFSCSHRKEIHESGEVKDANRRAQADKRMVFLSYLQYLNGNGKW